jgi:gas vesicle protein
MIGKRKTVTKKVVAGGALLGAAVGYLTGILTAPKSGKATRKDITKKASLARKDAEKKLKELHGDLDKVLLEADKQKSKAKTKANAELKEATDKAKVAKEKAREMLSAVRSGEAEDPNLQAVLEEVKLAKRNLAKYLKK